MSSEPFSPAPAFDSGPSVPPVPAGMVSAALIAPLEGSFVWARVLSILGLVTTTIILVIISVLALTTLADSLLGGLMMLVVGVPVVLLFYGIPSWRLHGYGSAVSALVTQRTVSQFEATLEAQRRVWRYLGGMAMVFLVVLGVLLVLAILGTLIGLGLR